MTFRSYGIVEDADNDVLVMGVKKVGYLKGFLVFFGGRVEQSESTKEASVREVKEETHDRVKLSLDDTHRFASFVAEPAQMLFFFRSTGARYTVGEIPFGEEISSVVAVSIDKVLAKLPEDPGEVSAAKVAQALIDLYGGGADVRQYRDSLSMWALARYLVQYHYDER